MNRNSQNRQFANNFPGYLASQHQQPQFFNNTPPPPLEGGPRFPHQGAAFNGRSVLQSQGQNNINSASVPAAPTARFDGQLPFHTQGSHQQWLQPAMMSQHNIMPQGGPHQLSQRQYMYTQTGQQHHTYPYVAQPHYISQVRPSPAPAPQTTTFSSGLQQYHHTVPLQASNVQPHVQTQIPTQRTVPLNTITNQQIMPPSQGNPNQYPGTMTINPSIIPQHQQNPPIPKRVRKPLAVIDPETHQQVDLQKTINAEQTSSVSRTTEESRTEPSSTVESVKEKEPETSKESLAPLNAEAEAFVPHEVPNQPAGQATQSDEQEVTTPLVSAVATEATRVSPVPDRVPTPESDKEKNEEVPNAKQPAVCDSSETKTESSSPTELEDVHSADAQKNAADETVSEKAVIPEQQSTENKEASVEPSDGFVNEKRTSEKSVQEANGDANENDATGEPSENEGPSQDEDEGASDSSSPPAYNFRPDSTEAPATTEQRKLHYDRNYLINLQRCKAAMKQPLGLPEELIEQGVILKTAHPLDLSKPLPALKAKGMDDFTPDYVRLQSYARSGRYSRDGQRPGQSGSGGSRYGNAASNQRRGSQQSSRRIEVAHRPPIKIHQSENAYIPANLQRLRGRPNTEEDSEEARTQAEKNKRQRVCFSQLNKLTPQNSDIIFDQIRESGILCDAGGIDDIAAAIFKKAITEPPYSVALADLVSKIMGEYETDEMAKHKTFFKQNLLSRCQTMFETELDKQVSEEEDKMRAKMDNEKDPKIKAMLGEEVEEAKLKVRQKYYGNIKFVGELYLRGLVGAKTIHDCVAMLLQHKTEESIESVCKFLETTGAKLDQGQATVRVDHYFQRIEKIKEKIECQRLKFKLEDLIDMRRRRWKLRERAAEYQVRPRTRAELERERIEEEHKKQATVDKMMARKREEGRYGGSRGSSYGRTSGGPAGLMTAGRRSLQPDSSSQMPANPDGWKTVTRRVDPRSLTINKTESNDTDFKLGPGNSLSKWSQGCRTKGRDGSDRVTATKNLGRQGLSPSPRNSANSSRRGSNSNIPAAVSSTSTGDGSSQAGSGREMAAQSRSDQEQIRNGATGMSEAGASADAVADRPPLDSKLRTLIENKTNHIFSEYSVHKEFDMHAFEPIKMYGDVYVESLVQHVIEKSKLSRIDAGNMIAMMIQKGYLRPEEVSEGLKPHFEVAADILMDVPKFYSYIAELLSGCLCDEIMAILPSIMAPLEKEPEVASIVCEMLHLASEENGHDKVGLMFRTAGLDWNMFLSPSMRMDDFINTNKLEFTLTGGVPKIPDSSVSLDDLEMHLKELVTKPNVKMEDVFSLLETSVDKRTSASPPFINTVVQTITSVSLSNSDFELLHRCCPVLKYIIDKKADRMLQTLFAIQQITPNIRNPSRINYVFEVLSDNNVISDDAYISYYELKKPDISEGYELTIRSTANFYATLMNT